MKPKTSLLFLLVSIISATSFLAPGSAQEEPSQEYRRAKAVSIDKAVRMLKRYGIIDPHATGKFVTSAMSEIGKEYKENPIAAISEEFLYHFMMYNDGVENLSDYPYIDKIFELYKRANTEQPELQAHGLAEIADAAEALARGMEEIVGSAMSGRTPSQGEPPRILRRVPVQCLEAFAAAGAKIANYPACRDNIFAIDPFDQKLLTFLCTQCAKTSPNQVNVAGANGWTPLMYVARYSPADACAEACRLLIQAGADVNAKNSEGWTPLMIAARYSTAEACRLLIQAGADVNAKNSEGWTPLMEAARYSTAEACRLLIQAGADVNAKKNDGWTPLMLAAQFSTAETCRLLIQAGAKVDEGNNKDETALMQATRNTEHPDVCGVLLDAGASVHTKDKDGWTPIIWAATYSSAAICERLIKLGADVNAKLNDGWTPLMFAARYSTAEACRLLIQAGADVNAKKDNGCTPLILAAQYSTAEACRLLTQAGADVNAKKDNGCTPLILAAQYSTAEACRLLIQTGADVNAKNNFGCTPLMLAVFCGEDDKVDLLLKNHADVRVLVPIGDGEQRVSLLELAKELKRGYSNPFTKEELIKKAREANPNAKLNYQEVANLLENAS